jgi:hypothetical protein
VADKKRVERIHLHRDKGVTLKAGERSALDGAKAMWSMDVKHHTNLAGVIAFKLTVRVARAETLARLVEAEMRAEGTWLERDEIDGPIVRRQRCPNGECLPIEPPEPKS